MKLPMKSPEHSAVSVPLLWRDRPPASLPGEFFFPSYSGGQTKARLCPPSGARKNKTRNYFSHCGLLPKSTGAWI